MPILALLLSAVLLQTQDAPETHLGRAYEAMKLERYDEAVAEFRAALRLQPALTSRARFPLAVALFELKRPAEAREEFEAVRREIGDHPNVSYYLGRLDLADQRYPDAIRNLNAAMAQPPFPDTAYHLGFACLKQGDLVMAEKWLKVAEQATPADATVHYQLALVYRQEGREEEAKKTFAISAELRRQGAEESRLRLECAQILERGPSNQARTICSRLFDPNNAAKLTALGTLYGQHGDLEAALDALRRAAELDPQSPQVQYNLAFTYFELNRFEEARVPIAGAVARWPDVFQLNSLYGAVLLKLGQDHEAWPVLRRAHKLNQSDARTSDVLCATALRLGRASFEARQFSAALHYFEEAAKLRPADAGIQRQVGEARVQADRHRN